MKISRKQRLQLRHLLYQHYRCKVYNFLLMVGIILALIFVVYATKDNAKEQNKYHCAVLGYEEDCRTPLPADRRLK